MSNQYNKVYEKLVKSQNDYTGMIAYCIYKDEKRKWIQEGHEAEEFVRLKLMKHELKKYKKSADELLTKVFQANADEEAEKIQKLLSQEMVAVARKSMNKSRGAKFWSWHNSGAAGMFGNFYTGAVVAILVWILSTPEAWTSAIYSAKETVMRFISTNSGG